MQSPAHDLAKYLAAQGIGIWASDSGWAVSAQVEPASPDTAVTVYDTGGEGLDTDDMDIENATVQVRVRGPNPEEAYQKQVSIRDLLKGSPIQGETSRFDVTEVISGITHIGRDDNNRHLLVQNFRLMRMEA